MELLTPQFGLLFWSIIGILVFSIWLTALVRILKANFKDSTTKLTWILLIIFIPLIGSILYLAIGRNLRITNN